MDWYIEGSEKLSVFYAHANLEPWLVVLEVNHLWYRDIVEEYCRRFVEKCYIQGWTAKAES